MFSEFPVIAVVVGVFVLISGAAVAIWARRGRGTTKEGLTVAKDGYIDVDGEEINIGKTEEWAAFVRRNPEFMKRKGPLETALNQVLNRRFSTDNPADRVVFGFGYLIADEFMEVLVLAANGFGTGALRVTRLMFEQLVTASYISTNPNQVNPFVNYYWIQQKKLATAVEQSGGGSLIKPEKLAEINDNYEKYKNDYLVTVCEKCKSTRLNHTWHKLDVVSMAKKVNLGNLIVEGYLLPLRETHATIPSLMNRIEEGARGILFGAPRRDLADVAMAGAHGIVLYMLDLQRQHFELKEFENAFEGLVADYTAIWGKDGGKNLATAALKKAEDDD